MTGRAWRDLLRKEKMESAKLHSQTVPAHDFVVIPLKGPELHVATRSETIFQKDRLNASELHITHQIKCFLLFCQLPVQQNSEEKCLETVALPTSYKIGASGSTFQTSASKFQCIRKFT